jgi:hypothetical protein
MVQRNGDLGQAAAANVVRLPATAEIAASRSARGTAATHLFYRFRALALFAAILNAQPSS